MAEYFWTSDGELLAPDKTESSLRSHRTCQKPSWQSWTLRPRFLSHLRQARRRLRTEHPDQAKKSKHRSPRKVKGGGFSPYGDLASIRTPLTHIDLFAPDGDTWRFCIHNKSSHRLMDGYGETFVKIYKSMEPIWARGEYITVQRASWQTCFRFSFG